MNIHDYRDKVLGCWLGKNIGGTLGAPFECKRGVFPVEFYTQDTHGEPLPNDDLDLQLVWLNAVEKYSRSVNSSILGEYWLMYIVPNWGEYGAGKNNLTAGLLPPLSGYVNNVFFNTLLDYQGDPFIQPGVPRKLRLTVENQFFKQQWLTVRWYLPAGWKVTPGSAISLPLEQYHCNLGTCSVEFTLEAGELNEPRYDLVLQISSLGHPSQGLIPVTLLHVPWEK
jgi:hypothetical protein